MLTYNAPLAKFSSWKIGGAAKCLYQPKNLAELQTFLKILPSEEPVRYLGLGSNTLIRDGGIAETVVILLGVVTELEIVAPNEVKVGAGVSCAQFARFCARSGLVGMIGKSRSDVRVIAMPASDSYWLPNGSLGCIDISP